MNKSFFVILLILLAASACKTTDRFQVTPLGYEPVERLENTIYALPKTHLKIGVIYERTVHIPGPYRDYALKLLGIEGVVKKRSETWHISDVQSSSFTGMDPEHFYSLSLLEGNYNRQEFASLSKQGMIITELSDPPVERTLPGEIPANSEQVVFEDVTMESNVELVKETIYKTILTDTSFEKVPMVSEQLERKTLEKKAEEAARLILELRSDRYYVSAGLLDPYPKDFDLATSLDRMDKLEEAYLSLFTGKTFTQRFYREYHVTPPGSGPVPDTWPLDAFSLQQGFDSPEGEGNPLEVTLSPTGETRSIQNLMPQLPEEERENRIYYRIPETCILSIRHGETILHEKRLDLFQMGGMVHIQVR